MEYQGKKILMKHIYNVLIKEMGETNGKSLYEWYCDAYNVIDTDEAPDDILIQVLGGNDNE